VGVRPPTGGKRTIAFPKSGAVRIRFPTAAYTAGHVTERRSDILDWENKMISPSYNIDEFIERIKDMDWHDMVPEVCREGEQARRRSEKGKAAAEAVRQGSLKYAALLGGFAFFLQNSSKPAGLTDAEFQLFRPVCEKLVQKGQLKPEALELFDIDRS
jgi:hypothetical protein